MYDLLAAHWVLTALGAAVIIALGVVVWEIAAGGETSLLLLGPLAAGFALVPVLQRVVPWFSEHPVWAWTGGPVLNCVVIAVAAGLTAGPLIALGGWVADRFDPPPSTAPSTRPHLSDNQPD